MRFIHTLCLSLALTVSSTSLTAQAQNGSGYFLHTVTKGQSLYSIASMYHVTVDDIVRLNPGSRDQIRAGEARKIPQVQTSNQSSSTFHTIQAGETLYQLTVKYNITAQAICDANPGLSARNFRIGQVIVIPAQGTASSESAADVKRQEPEQPVEKEKGWKDMHKVERKETIFSISQMYGISQEELIEHVWDSSVDSFSGSIRVHMSSLRKKLKAELGYDPVVNKIGEGYKIGGNDKT